MRLARRLGWRAYVIPLLAVLTAWVLLDVLTGGSAGDGAVPGGAGRGPAPVADPESGLDVGELPPGADYPTRGSGAFVDAGSPGAAAGRGRERTLRYAVQIEDVLDAGAVGGADAFGATIDATLADPRGWTADPAFAVRHVAADEDPDTIIRLVTPDTAGRLCGREMDVETSCRIGAAGDRPGQILVNVARWTRGALPFEGDLGAYRQYLINHEVGHALGYAAHQPCPAEGELAPVMMQQTLSLDNSELHNLAPHEVYPDDGATCRPNGWPYPAGRAPR